MPAAPASSPASVRERTPGLAEDRRTRRKAESRRRLLEAGRRLFVERGYHATRPADIAQAADVGNGTFYLHFPDKRALFLAFVDEANAELREEMARRVDGVRGFGPRLYAALDAVFDYGERHPGVIGACFADTAWIDPVAADGAAQPTLRGRLVELLAEGLRQAQRRGEIRDDYDLLLVSHAVVGMVQQAATYWGRRGGDREALLRNLVSFCTRALERSGAATEEGS